jgi:hypothetical protein
MRPTIQKHTEAELTYRIRHREYGFVNGKWQMLIQGKPTFPVEIQLYISPETDEMYLEALRIHNPLAEWWG